MLTALLRFEFHYQLKQFAFLGFSLIFLAFGYMQGSQGYVNALVNFNSPYQLFFNIGLTTIGCEFAIMFFAISGLLRDQKHQMESIIYSTPVLKKHFFASRFIGVFVLSLVVFSMSLVGFGLGTLAPNLAPERLAPFDIRTYIWTWLTIVLPNVYICTAVLFSIAAWTKNNVATYVSAVLIYFLYIFGSMYFNSPLMARAVPASPENLIYAALIDPFGLAAFFEQTQYWTPYQKNHQSIAFSGWFAWNRIIWVGLSSLFLAITYRFFSFRGNKKKFKKIERLNTELPQLTKYQPFQQLIFNRLFHWKNFLALLKIECKMVFKSLPFLAVLLVWALISFINVYERIHQGGDYNDSLYPTTNMLLAITRDPIMSLLLIVFFSGELVWKIRDLKFNGIVAATPVSNGILFVSKMVTLVFIPIIIMLSSSLICIGFQIFNGYYQLEIGQYLSAFYFSQMEFFFYILLSLFIQALVNNKYLGMVITALIIIILTTPIAGYLGIEHPLLQLGKLPYVGYTNMNGYANTSKAFNYYVVYWNALGFILALFAFKLWQRGSLHQLSARLRSLLGGWQKWERISLLVLCTIFLSAGSAIYYNVNILNEYSTSQKQLDFKENYERTFKQYEPLEKLTLMEVKTELDIFPTAQKYTVKTDYLLENRTDTPITQLFLTERVPLTLATLENAHLIQHDSIFDTRLFELDSPLLPNQQVNFSFQLTEDIKGFATSKQLIENGSYISQHHFKPMLGYRKSIEIKDEFERKKRGLPKRKEEKITDNHIHNHQYHNAVPIQFETIISTQQDQIAIAPGDLIKKWQANNRSYFQYKASERIMESINYFSANYETKIANHRGIAIEQYYHPGHAYNIQNTELYTQLALDYCIQNFGNYPYNHLRIAEIPGHWPFGGQAMPGTISMVEDRFYLIDNTNPNGFDLVAKRTIHEVAHQWWGMFLRPKIIEGGSFLLEGLAKYTEAVVMEQQFGMKAIWQLSESANRRYFSGRAFANENEPPLYYSDGEGYLSYGKSLVALLALKELIGEATINKVLKNLVKLHRNEMKPTSTSIEFIEGLYAVSPPEYHVLIDDWFKRVITYDLKLETIATKQTDNGQYEVRVSIAAKRIKTLTDGSTMPIAINEPIQLGVFAKHPKTVDKTNSILYLQPHQITKEKMEFTIILAEQPKYIAIDPFGTRLEKNRMNNIKRIEF